MINFYSPTTELWRIKELDSIIDEFDEIIRSYLNNNEVKREENYLNIVLDIAAKSIVTFREVLCLCNCGFPDGALSLARNLCEQFFVISFFENVKESEDFDNYIYDYYLDYEIQRVKKNQKAIERFDKSKGEELEHELEELQKKSIRYKKRNYWWANVNSFKELCDIVIENTDDETIGLINNLLLGYDRACVSLHSSCLGNSVRLIYDKESTAIDTSPSEKGHSVPLWLATTSFIWIVGVTGCNLGIETELNKPLNDLSIFYLNKMNEEFRNA